MEIDESESLKIITPIPKLWYVTIEHNSESHKLLKKN